ncbi:cysteine desulfurase CsdA [Shimwellia blattae]|uniref:cysteine desulfurase n=1 Tax=Shimwellia blattae (strain ATCC 29907 / DSM 4481 / JCM 1650 / NBRC 105725 / CDC 9005-74) TaxID=630626 RepID=I2B5Y6_SHIBC|nr:cysteine desulfurase CsdA [Shimwellia blattae]AFJ45940.1 cysteine sulfinate desulfinase [Shimwellia blattae DSM 4481 = NBRC 105725]GAB81697.1 cysteine sulfinate desulfinase [Shimwellia blattae DSM 4481 = NBRC 105725]VDY63416.1 Cysteine sulfinate desulfinase [Shimwellia blattae]VEC21290.1 Cysteine sulfinate desulfinase [Shimwellia blattae]
MNAFSPAHFRSQFPALSGAESYLDSAATTLKPEPVIAAIHQYYSSASGSVHRSQSRQARLLTDHFESARASVARLLRAPHPEDIVWTSGTTEALNIVARCYVQPRLAPGDELIVSEAEHHANLVPWLMVARQCGANVIKLPLNAQHLPDLDQLPALLTPRTRVLALGQMSNVTGGAPDLARAISLAHASGAIVVVDGAQGIAHTAVDVNALDIDFYAFSAHKLYGPTGTGALYGRRELLREMSPWLGGGKMVKQVSFSGFTVQDAPWGLEAGTPNIAGVIGLNAALEWLETVDRPQAEHYTRGLATQAEALLSRRPGFRSYRSQDASLLAFNFDGVHYGDLATLLAESGVTLRAGQHCAQPLLAALGVSGTLRASFAPYNTADDVTRLVGSIDLALDLLLD